MTSAVQLLDTYRDPIPAPLLPAAQLLCYGGMQVEVQRTLDASRCVYTAVTDANSGLLSLTADHEPSISDTEAAARTPGADLTVEEAIAQLMVVVDAAEWCVSLLVWFLMRANAQGGASEPGVITVTSQSAVRKHSCIHLDFLYYVSVSSGLLALSVSG